MPITATFENAKIRRDGQTITVMWKLVGSRYTTAKGAPNPRIGEAAGKYLSVTYNGSNYLATCMGSHSQDHNRPQGWLNSNTRFVAGGTPGLAVGYYFFTAVVKDATDTATHWHHWSAIGNSTGAQAMAGYQNAIANAKALYTWREPVPTGGWIDIYGSFKTVATDNLPILTQSRCEHIPFASLVTPTSCNIQNGPDNTNFISWPNTYWVQDYKLDSPVPYKAACTISAPAGLIVDENGNATEMIANATCVNRSCLGTNGKLAVPENPTIVGGNSLINAERWYVSTSHGNDSTSAVNDITKPALTVKTGIMPKLDSSHQNVRISFLRGDTTLPSDTWFKSLWGTDEDHPMIWDDYWNPTYGADPGTRPVVRVGHGYWDSTAVGGAWPDARTLIATPTGGAFGTHNPENDDRPFTYIANLRFLRDPRWGSWTSWPGNTVSDSCIITNCIMEGCGVTISNQDFGRAPVDSMLHRTVIFDVHRTNIDVAPDSGGGTSLVLPLNFVTPAPQGTTTSGTTVFTTYDGAEVNQGSKLMGFTISLTDGTNTDVRLFTTATGTQRQYTVDTAWAHTFSGNKVTTIPTISPATGSTSTTTTAGRAVAGVTLAVTSTSGFPIPSTTYPTCLVILRGGSLITVLKATSVAGLNYTIAGPIPGYADATVNNGDTVAHQTIFQIRMGPGASSTTSYRVTGWNAGTRTLTTDIALPTIDPATTGLVFLPDIPWDTTNQQGTFGTTTGDFLIADCVYDRCGWMLPNGDASNNTGLSHDAYLSFQTRGMVVRDTWWIAGGSVGLQQRGGGTNYKCIFTLSAHGYYTSSTSSYLSDGLLINNGNQTYVTKWHYEQLTNHTWVFRTIFGRAGNFAEKRQNANLQYDSYVAVSTNCLISAAPNGESCPSYEINEQNTFIGTTVNQRGYRRPITGGLFVNRSLLLSQPTDVDINSRGIQIYTELTQAGWNDNGPYHVATSATWVTSIDYNAYMLPPPTIVPIFNLAGTATSTFSTWQAAGYDTHSTMPVSVTVPDVNYTLDKYAAEFTPWANFTAMRAALIARPLDAFGPEYSTAAAIDAFRAKLKPLSTDLPAIDTSKWGFIGVTDYRAAGGGSAGNSEVLAGQRYGGTNIAPNRKIIYARPPGGRTNVA